MEFSLRLKQLRSEKGVSQRELAEQIHVSRSAVAKWENGLGLPGEDSARLLAEYFGLSEEELLPERGAQSKLVEKNRLISRQRRAILCLAAALGLALVGAVAWLCPSFRGYVAPFCLGGLIIALGVFNLRGNIATIHWYQRRKVSREDQRPYCRLMGLGTILCGAGVSVFALLAALFGEGWSEYAALAGILPGLALMCFAQFKYNRGLF